MPPNAVAVPVVFRMLRSALKTVSTFVDELLAGVRSVVDEETVAVFETVPDAGAVTLIVIGFAGPTASVGIVHVTVPAAKPQVQPVPDALVKPTPAGSTSLTETFDATPGPLFVTESV